MYIQITLSYLDSFASSPSPPFNEYSVENNEKSKMPSQPRKRGRQTAQKKTALQLADDNSVSNSWMPDAEHPFFALPSYENTEKWIREALETIRFGFGPKVEFVSGTDEREAGVDMDELSLITTMQNTSISRRKTKGKHALNVEDALDGEYWEANDLGRRSKRPKSYAETDATLMSDDFLNGYGDDLVDAEDTEIFKVSPVTPIEQEQDSTAGSAERHPNCSQSLSSTSTCSSVDFGPDVGFMPSAANNYQFQYSGPISGRTPKQLDRLLQPTREGDEWPYNTFMPNLSYERRGNFPQPGLAERLVKEMEEREEQEQKKITADKGEEWLED